MASESTTVATEPTSGNGSKAQELASRHATVEDVPDEELPSTSSPAVAADASRAPSSSANKQPSNGPIDTQSRELFPELGAPKSTGNASTPGVWGPKCNGGTPTNGISRSSTPGVVVPASADPQGPAPMTIPGRNVESVALEPQYILPRTQLKRPIPDIIKDINRKSRAKIAMVPISGGRLRFDATGTQDVAQQALRDLVSQIGTKVSIKVPIPHSARAHVIGRGGSTIKALQEKTGAKIQLPKAEEGSLVPDEDDDTTIDVTVEGNTVSAASARNEILKIVAERTASMQTKLRGIPAEFFPFIAGPRNSTANELEENHGIYVRVPSHQAWSAQKPPAMPAPGERPVFAAVAADDDSIQLAGDRSAVQQVRAEIERRVAELRAQLDVERLSIQRGRHQFIIGDRGVAAEDFFADTGCSILLPTDEDDDMITIIGPSDKVQVGLEKAMDLAMNMQCSNIDIGRLHRNAPGGAAAHARNVTRYLRQRQEIARIESLYNTHINTPFSQEGALPWELFSRDGKNAIRAQSEITGIINSHPPSRMSSVDVDSFFHQHLRKNITPRVKESFGVQVVVPEPSEPELAVLLVYEGPESDGAYQIPRTQPTAEDVKAFGAGLEAAQKLILDLINKQEQISSTSIDVPHKFHDKLKKFIKNEQSKRSDDQIGVRVSSLGTTVTLRGPQSAVDSLATKVNAFVEQEKQDEKERDYTTSFDFPQKYANHLIGKGGSHIRELRDRFDVEIQVQDGGKVELKGPKAKADACKSHVLNWGRALADETTHVMKIDPKFHRELIGAQGSQINRLQDRYKVLIFFPRTVKAGSDDQTNDTSSDCGKPQRQQAPDEVIIRGPKQGADGARDEIFALHNFLKDTSFTGNVTMQQKHVPLLIGQGGMALDEIRQSTGARIDVPGARDNETVEIQIKGTKAEVEAAKKSIEARRAVLEDTVVRELEVDRKYHRDLIGPGGSTLRSIILGAGGSDDRRERSRAVQFPKQDSDGNKIKIEGRSAVVDKIVARIEEMVAERQSQVVEIVDVPVEKHRALIGRGGDIKRKLESQFGVSIDIPRQGDSKTGVKISGRPENVEKAKEHIADMVKEQQGETVQVPRRLHAAISNNGQFFRKLRSDLHVSVDHAGHPIPQKPAPATPKTNGGALPLITDDPSSTADVHSWSVVDNVSSEKGDMPWVLRGSPENVEKAKGLIRNAMQQAEKNSSVGYLTLPDAKLYRHIIGPNGSKINSIRKQSGCNINVPRDQAKDEAIEVVGSAEGVEKAKDLILTAVREGSRPRDRD